MKRHANVAIFVPHAGCPHACSFCDQKSISGRVKMPAPADVAHTLERALQSLGDDAAGAEIAFFGGSFTAIDPGSRDCLLQAVGPYRSRFAGIRISTRPDGIDKDILASLRGFGVTAIELGAQSMDDAVLTLAGRGHTALEVERASRLIREGGFSLGLQMMTGLPGDTPAGARETARRLAALSPDTVRVYPALTLRQTRLECLYRAGAYTPDSLEAAVELCAELLLFFTERGIRVIRLGLHDTPSLRESLVVGPWHPALRELCEGKLLLAAALEDIEKKNIPPGPLRLYVATGAQSKMAGQNRRNLLALEERGYRAGIFCDGSLGYLQARAEV